MEMSQDSDELQVEKKDRLLELKLAVALNEVECSRVARAEMEKALQLEQDRHQQTQRKHDSDFSRHLESIHKLRQQLGKVEATSMLLPQQMEKRDDIVQLQAEGTRLSQQLAEANEKAMAQEQVMAAMQRHFKDCLSQIQAENREKVQILEEQNRKLTARNAELQELLAGEQVERDSTLCHMQKVLVETQMNLAVCEESLKARTGNCTILDEEKGCLQGNVNWLEGKLQKSDDENVQLKRCLHNLKLSLDDKERELAVSSQKLQEALSETPNIEQALLQLVESVQRLAADNARLEQDVKRQTGTISELQEEAEEALLMKAGLEEQLTQKAQLEQAEEEAALLRRHLQEAQKRAEDKEREVVDVQKCFGDALDKMRAETLELATSNLQLQELLQIERSKTESTVWQLQEELAETKNEVLLCTTSLGVSNNYCSTIDEEKLDMQKYIIRLEGMLKESEDKYVQSEQQVKKLISTLRDQDCEVSTTSQKLQEMCLASTSMDKTTQHLRESLQQLESENTGLVEAAKQQSSRISELEKEIEEAATLNTYLEEQSVWEIQKQSLLPLNTQAELNETGVALKDEREFSKVKVLPATLQAQLEQVQTEKLMFQQQLEEAQQMTQVEDQTVIDIQDCMKENIAEMQAYKEEKVLLVENRSNEVVPSENTELQDFIDHKKVNRDSSLRQLQKELADMQNKLSLCEESLEDTTRRCIDLAVKNQSIPEEMNTLHRMLQENKDKYVQTECFNVNLKCSMDDQEIVSISTNTDETMESLQQLESKSLSLEEAEKQQACIIVELVEAAEEATRVKKDLEEQLGQEKQKPHLGSINSQVDTSETEAALQDEREKFQKSQSTARGPAGTTGASKN
ncbi:hypothetical protein AAFF_G00119190 [Aldrovandia affinis]|uniref:CCDC144C-like coiled-coil domain-containing protein n=1 Tax=Aldrovandia affinis TaxID=143900 RepID=A0AAD7RSF7_9TELE|nr:hypothetical protein AAFF_G00119190 [Aldrovandia affinis]